MWSFKYKYLSICIYTYIYTYMSVAYFVYGKTLGRSATRFPVGRSLEHQSYRPRDLKKRVSKGGLKEAGATGRPMLKPTEEDPSSHLPSSRLSLFELKKLSKHSAQSLQNEALPTRKTRVQVIRADPALAAKIPEPWAQVAHSSTPYPIHS